jgi:hypothetical protein
MRFIFLISLWRHHHEAFSHLTVKPRETEAETEANPSILSEFPTPRIAQSHYDPIQATSRGLAAWHSS